MGQYIPMTVSIRGLTIALLLIVGGVTLGMTLGSYVAGIQVAQEKLETVVKEREQLETELKLVKEALQECRGRPGVRPGAPIGSTPAGSPVGATSEK